MSNTVKNKPIVYTDADKAIVKAFEGREEDNLTLADICRLSDFEVKAGHIASAKNKGLIETVGETEVMRPTMKKVRSYSFVTAEPQNKEDGKPFNYTDGEKEILAVASKLEGAFTLEDLANAMGLEKLASGRLTGLTIKGNIDKEDLVDVETTYKSKVKLYAIVAGAADKVNA